MRAYRPALLCCLFLGVSFARAESPFRFPAGKLGDKAELKYVNNIPVLTVAGSPEEMGASVGALALKPGARVLGYPRELLVLRGVDTLWGYARAAGKSLYKQFPAEYHDELEALT